MFSLSLATIAIVLGRRLTTDLRVRGTLQAVSLVLYGPTSIGKKGALKRSTSHEHHKGAHWQLKAIPAPLVALAVTIVRSLSCWGAPALLVPASEATETDQCGLGWDSILDDVMP